MRTRTTFAAAFVIATLGLAVAACGGGSGAGSSGLGGAASISPSNAVGFVALDTNVSSSQWQTVDGLLKKFPAQGDLMTKLQQSFEKHTQLNWTTDVQPALGSELDLIALPSGSTATKPQLGQGLVSAQIGGWTAFSDSQAALDAVQSATAKLADNNTYRAATAKLSADALVRAYANGTEAQQLLDALGPQTPTSGTNT